MGEVKWSPEQLKVINSRKQNLLVSAAAGAGKTTVMVERILALITEGDIDIDRLLVVTFTKDAASQMKEKISDRISEALEKDPDNRRLVRQQMLLRNACITTIDSFCMSIVKEFSHEIDIDPVFRVGQNAELKLIKSQVLKKLLEEKYEEADTGFEDMIETFCNSKSDAAIEKLILTLASAAQAHPWPMEWLDRLEAEFAAEQSGSTSIPGEWTDFAVRCVHGAVREALVENDKLMKLCELLPHPDKSMAVALEDREIMAGLLQLTDFEELSRAYDGVKLPTARFADKEADQDLMERIKNIRADYKKKAIEKPKEAFFFVSPDENRENMQIAAGPVLELIKVTREFIVRFGGTKREKNILDFGDLEHFALDILAQKNPDGTVTARPAAMELHDRFKELFVDEYQDSNFVQEQIIETIAGASGESPYTFTVGDVKQSIYRFRMAKPELFMNRFCKYRSNPDEGEVISLGMNFRSRPEVLDSTNDVFYLSMTEPVGGVTYDEEAALVCGQRKVFEDGMPADNDYKTEILLVDCGDLGEDEDADSETLRKAEAHYAALRVKKLVESGFTIAKGKKEERKIGYGDVVILLRAVGGWANYYIEAFETEGIPIFSNKSAGFLGSYEITVMLNYLRILDNPCQDIPLASVCKSVIGGFSADELAAVKSFGGLLTSFWEALTRYGEEGPDAEIREKVIRFLSTYDSIRSMNLNRDIDKVIAAIYDKTGFDLFCTALPGGDRRSSNLEMLMSYAAEYESGSFSGLFSFVRYLEEILTSEEDLEEAVNQEAADAVRIMTIHGSKGLEFPVVIVGGMGREITNIDGNSGVIISSDYGIAAPATDLKMRHKSETLRRKLVQKMLGYDNLGEELRLLYVAMTRAKYKLILAGGVKKPEKCTEQWEFAAQAASPAFSEPYIANAKRYLDFVYPAYLRNKSDFEVVTPEDGMKFALPLGSPEASDIISEQRADFENEIRSFEGTSDISELLRFEYPYTTAEALPTKLSVSDIKHAAMEDEGERAPWVAGPASAGAARGTLYHLVMQFIPFTLKGTGQVSEFLDSLEKRDIIDSAEKDMINPADIAAFLETPLARRMAQADAENHLRREQPFVLGRKACEINPEKYAGMESIIPVQGIIDCMFSDNGHYVILDYKTDHVGPGQSDVLVKRYKAQLQNYAAAVSQIIGAPVDECLIYSFALGEVIDV